MIMRNGQQLLLPAKPLFIWGSLLAALLYFPAGKVTFEAGVEFIPPWLREELARM